MDVLLTGAHGRVGWGIKEHIASQDDYNFTYLNRSDREEYETFVADVSDYEAMRPAFDGKDAVIHLAAYPEIDGTWDQILENNIIGTHNALEAARDAGVEKFIYASSFHTVGMYELDNKPEVYNLDHDLMIDHTSPVRPDSFYGVSKVMAEGEGRYYIENYEYPKQFYSIRIASVRWPEYDNPYGDAEAGVERGDWEYGSEEYKMWVKRLKATWLSQRDNAQLHEKCLEDDSVDFDVFYGVSDNPRAWFDIDHARDVIGYEPEDNGEECIAPPKQ